MEDFYATLGVAKEATDEEIKQAYRRKAAKHHPDREGGDEAEFKRVGKAYDVLGNVAKRKAYDNGEYSDGPVRDPKQMAVAALEVMLERYAVEDSNLIPALLKDLHKGRDQVQAELTKAKRNMVKVEKRLKNVRPKKADVEPVICKLLEKQVAKLKGEVVQHEFALATIGEVEKIINGHEDVGQYSNQQKQADLKDLEHMLLNEFQAMNRVFKF